MEVKEWTNTRQAPSDLPLRYAGDTIAVAQMMNVYQCDDTYVASRVLSGYGKSFVMTDRGGYTKEVYSDSRASFLCFNPVMQMSGMQDEKDFISTVRPADGVIAKGRYFTVNCDGVKTHVGVFESCGNMAILHEAPCDGVFFEKNGKTEHTMPIAGTLPLIIIGAIGAVLFNRRTK